MCVALRVVSRCLWTERRQRQRRRQQTVETRQNIRNNVEFASCIMRMRARARVKNALLCMRAYLNVLRVRDCEHAKFKRMGECGWRILPPDWFRNTRTILCIIVWSEICVCARAPFATIQFSRWHHSTSIKVSVCVHIAIRTCSRFKCADVLNGWNANASGFCRNAYWHSARECSVWMRNECQQHTVRCRQRGAEYSVCVWFEPERMKNKY